MVKKKKSATYLFIGMYNLCICGGEAVYYICYDRWTESTGQSTGRPVDVPVVIFVFRPLAALPMSSTYQSDDWHTSLLTGSASFRTDTES